VNYDPNMKGVLFKNDKGDNDKRPDYRGSAVINNVDYNISGWIKVSKKSGDKYMSLKFESKRPAQKQKTLSEDNWSDPDAPF